MSFTNGFSNKEVTDNETIDVNSETVLALQDILLNGDDLRKAYLSNETISDQEILQYILVNLEKNDYCYGNKLLQVVLESGNFGRKKYKTLVPGTKKSMETAKRTFVHYVKFFGLAPIDMLFLIPKRIRITMKKRM